MEIQVVKYQNYGCMNWGPLCDDNDTHKIKWYYCFFELNNGRIIHSQFEEYWKDGVNIHNDLDFFNTKNYNFGQNFWTWWDTTFEKPHPKPLTIHEVRCVEDFFSKNIENKREKKTEIINIISNC